MWPFDIKRKRRDAEYQAFVEVWYSWEKSLIAKGYSHWVDTPPPNGVWIETTRREWPTNRIWQTGNDNPLMNVADLWWRPWRGETIVCDIFENLP